MDPKIIEYKNDVLENRATLVITNLNEVRIYHQPCVKDAYALKKRSENLTGFIAVQKTIGKAGFALLYSMGVREIHAINATEDLVEFSKTFGDLTFTYDTIVQTIKNEENDEPCKINEAVKGLNNIAEINNKITEIINEQKKAEGAGTIVIK